MTEPRHQPWTLEQRRYLFIAFFVALGVFEAVTRAWLLCTCSALFVVIQLLSIRAERKKAAQSVGEGGTAL